MKHLRYYSEFDDNTNSRWRVEILQEADNPYTPEEITLSADNPVAIQWHTIEKTDTIMSSAATLTLNSDTDRQFLDLYQIDIDIVRLDIYRNGELYWSGTLDTELYEEPYSYQKNYDVQITFSDFALLERKDFDMQGIKTIEELISYCLDASGINYSSLVSYISTSRSNVVSSRLLSQDSVSSANFYDEDGEPLKLYDVLEAILKPYDLHIRQKAGKIYMWDWNAMYQSVASEQIIWDGDDAVLGVDKVYNKVVLTFSPYQVKEVLNPEIKGYQADVSPITIKDSLRWTYEELLDGFKIDYGTTARGITISNPLAKFYHIEAINSGNDSYGVAWRIIRGYFDGFGNKRWEGFLNNQAINSTAVPSSQKELFRVNTQPFIAGKGNGKSYKLKISLDLMFDPRYNPFEQAGDDNEKGAYEDQQDKANFAYVPIILNFRSTSGNVYHWKNQSVVFGGRYGNGVWISGEGTWGECYLAYYDDSERRDKSALTGFATNRRCIGAYLDQLPKIFTTHNEGEMVNSLPDFLGGTLEFKVGTGVMIWENRTDNPRQVVYDNCRWILYKDPKIEIVDKYGKTPEAEDVEIKAWLNKAAKEELSIDTIVGTTPGKAILAKGLIFQNNSFGSYSRGGHTGTLEQLLIGTIYSHYATRHAKLMGTALIPLTFATYTDRSTNELFALVGATENLIDGSAELELCELSPDEYEAIEYDED